MSDNEIRLEGRTVLVTGAGRGLGRSHALELAARGASVVVADNGTTMSGKATDPGPAEAVVKEIVTSGGRAVVCTADLSTELGSRLAIETALDSFGSIDGVLHNASTVPELTDPAAMSDRDLSLVLDINVRSGLWLARAAWPHMTEQAHGRFLYTTSAAIYGAQGNTPYGSAKGAIVGMVRCLAMDGKGRGIRVNAIAPSARTRMTETFLATPYGEWLCRTMPPEKVCGAAAYLLSDDCAVSGEIFAVGGGRIARIALAETKGVILDEPSAENVRDGMARIMNDSAFTYPANLDERTRTVAAMLGFQE